MIRALVPQNKVPEAAAVQAIARFNHASTPRSLVPLWIEWILMVLPVMDSTDKLRNLYGVLFYWMDYETIRPSLCHLLYVLTRRQDGMPTHTHTHTPTHTPPHPPTHPHTRTQ
jgi:centromere protein I